MVDIVAGQSDDNCFFFSSRRRHTRCGRDWSSDVCSSDLGFGADQRGQRGGFVGDDDVLDTWATSSLTPEIAGGFGRQDADLFSRVYPFDLRPQAHDIIRTWLFTTVLRAELGHGLLPFRHAAISGFVVDP